MVTRSEKIVLLVVAGLAMVNIAMAVLGGSSPLPSFNVTRREARFDAASALDYTRVLAEGYPDRVTGSPGARRAAGFLAEEFGKLGFRVEHASFPMWLAGRRVTGENVIAILPGSESGAVAVLAHYDGQTTSHQAAEDNASGVGVLLELARVVKTDPPPRHTLLLVATDAEEWGMIGARALVPFLKDHQTRAAISIDYLTAGHSPALRMDSMGQSSGYAPLWLRTLVIESGRVQGVRVDEPGPGWEWIERALEVSAQDQGPLLHAGIPALNISTESDDPAAVRARYHTPQDVFANLQLATFHDLGATVEQAVASLDTLETTPSSRSNDFRISSRRYLYAPAMIWIQLWLLVPLVVAGFFASREFRSWDRGAKLALLFRPVIYGVPPLVALAVLYVLNATNILKRYELYPATPKDPFLYEMPVQVTLPLLVAMVAGYFLVRILRRRLAGEPKSFRTRQRVLVVWACALVVAAWIRNPYAAWLFLGLFGYVTLILAEPRSLPRRAWNAALLLASALPFGALVYFWGREIYLGWRILWYLVLQTAYGVWSPFAAVLFLLALVVWVRLLRVAVFESYPIA